MKKPIDALARDLGIKIFVCISKLRLTQTQVIARCRAVRPTTTLTQSRLSAIVHGRASPSAGQLAEIASALQTTSAELLKPATDEDKRIAGYVLHDWRSKPLTIESTSVTMSKETLDKLHAGLQAVPDCEVTGIVIKYKGHQLRLHPNMEAADTTLCLFYLCHDSKNPAWLGMDVLVKRLDEALRDGTDLRDALDHSIRILSGHEDDTETRGASGDL